jgi:hypothetical protein
MTEKRQTSQGYIIRILQHFATKLWNIANFVMLFQAWNFCPDLSRLNFHSKGERSIKDNIFFVFFRCQYVYQSMLCCSCGSSMLRVCFRWLQYGFIEVWPKTFIINADWGHVLLRASQSASRSSVTWNVWRTVVVFPTTFAMAGNCVNWIQRKKRTIFLFMKRVMNVITMSFRLTDRWVWSQIKYEQMCNFSEKVVPLSPSP